METKQDVKFATGAELLKEYGAAVTSGNLERWISLWTESGVQMAPDAPKRTSRDEIRAAMDDLPGSALDGISSFALLHKDRSKLGKQWELAAFPVLRFARVEPNPTRLQINVMPLPGQDFFADSPAREVCNIEDWLQFLRNVSPHGLVFVPLEKPLPLQPDARHYLLTGLS